MRNSRLTLALILVAGTLPVACSRDEATPAGETAATAEMAPVPTGDSLTGPVALDAPDQAQRPERIYYDLMEFDWYARGEPLVHEGTAYDVAGSGPVALDARTLERVGEYSGVDVYRRDGDTHVYVPVYDGWWLGFAPGAAVPTADAAAGVASDSVAPDTSVAAGDTLAAR